MIGPRHTPISRPGPRLDPGGFSIVELLLILLILGGAVTWSTLQLEAVRSKQLLLRAAQSLDAFLEHQALSVLSAPEPVLLRLNQTEGTVIRILPGLIHNGAQRDAESIVFQLPRGIRFDGIRLPQLGRRGAIIQYSSDGTASPGTIILADSAGHSCSLTQALGGKRRLTCDEGR